MSSTIKSSSRPTSLPSVSVESSFNGFLNDEIRPSLASLLTLAGCSLLLQALSLPLGSVLACFFGLLTHKWYHIHGMKLTRKEMIFFDERNLLEISSGCDYNNPLAEDAATPATGPPDVCTKKLVPETIWEALFYDQRQLDIQKFYKEHYGPVWATAERARKTREQMKSQKTPTE